MWVQIASSKHLWMEQFLLSLKNTFFLFIGKLHKHPMGFEPTT